MATACDLPTLPPLETLPEEVGSHGHGGSPEGELARFGLRPRPVIDFSASVSPLGPPFPILEAWNGLAEELARYPSVEGEGVLAFYQERFGLDRTQVVAGNGATEILYLVPRVLGLRRVAVLMPSFHDYARALKIAGAEILPVWLSPEEDFAPPGLETLAAVLARSDALWIGNPNNPTGTLFQSADLRSLARRFPNKWLILDEAFLPFAGPFPDVSLAAEELPPNLLVVHSFTKFYALPGLRLGAALGAPRVMDRLRRFKEPWSVNRIADQVARLLVHCQRYESEVRRLVHAERERIHTRLGELPDLRVFSSEANFFLVRWQGPGDLDGVLRHLLEAGICVRDCRNFPYLDDGFFRFAIRQPEENERLLQELERCVHAAHG